MLYECFCVEVFTYEATIVSASLVMAHFLWLAAKIVLLKAFGASSKCSIHQIQPCEYVK